MDLSQDLLKFKCICFDHNRANVFTSESILLYEVSGCLANFRQSSAVNNVDETAFVWKAVKRRMVQNWKSTILLMLSF